MSKGLQSEEVKVDKNSEIWVQELKELLGLGVKLKPVKEGEDHSSKKSYEELVPSHDQMVERWLDKEEVLEEERTKKKKIRVESEKREQLRHDSIRDGQATLTVGKSIKSGCHGTVSFLDSDNGVPLVVKTPLSDTYQKELTNESELYEKIGDHPNIVRCYGMQETSDGKEGLVLERIQGCKEVKHAFQKLDKQYESGKLTYTEYIGTVQNVMRQLLTGLAKLEECGISHNDIKEDNVMIDSKTGTVKIIDIGMASEHGEDAKMGAPMYQAPDKRGEKSKATDDSYSAGAILQNMLEGQLKMLGKGEKAVDVVKGEFDSRQSGKARYESDYVKFINALTDPDPSKRLKPSEALKQPFLQESLLDEESSTKFLTGFLEDQPDRTQIAFALAEDFTSVDWMKTYENAVEEGAVPEAVSLSVAVSKGLDVYNDKTSNPSAKQKTLQGVIEAWKKMQAIPAYREHPIMSSYLGDRLEDARENLKLVFSQSGGPTRDNITFEVKGPSFDATCWGQAYQNAVAAGAVEPDPQGAAGIRETFGAYRTALESFKARPTFHELKASARYAVESLVRLGKQIDEIKKAPGFSENKVMLGLLKYFTDQIPEQRKPLDTSLKEVRPFTVVDGFNKKAFESTLDNAIKGLAVPDCKDKKNPVLEAFTRYEQEQPKTASDSVSWPDRAEAARKAVTALKDLDKAIYELYSFFRTESAMALGKYLEDLRKESRVPQDRLGQLAAWSDKLDGVKGLGTDKDGIDKVLKLSSAFQDLEVAYKDFDRSSDWDTKCKLATAAVDHCTKIGKQFESLGGKYPGALPEQEQAVADKLKLLNAFLDHGLDFTAEKKFVSASWAKSYKLAVNNAAVPKSDVDAQAITDGLTKFEDALLVYRDEKKDWDLRNAAGQDGIDGLTGAGDALRRLQLIDIYRKNPIMSSYLKWLSSPVTEELKVLQGSYDKFKATGKTVQVDSGFRAHWQAAKDEAEKDFDNAKPNMQGVSRRTKFSKYLPLEGGLSPALKDFEEACADAKNKPSTKATDKKKSSYAKVEKIIGEYRVKLITESRKWQGANIDPQHHFWTRLLKALNEIFTGVQKMK